MSRPQPLHRDAFEHFEPVQTRWMDNDIYGHVNNVVYYAYFDSCVNRFLFEQGVLDFNHGTTAGLVVNSSCSYFQPLAFPQTASAGLRVLHLGTSSVQYELAIFRHGDQVACAQGTFTHVYVDRQTRRPVPVPANMRAVLAPLRVGEAVP